ncbi:expressed unknown protein [Seminavis robusta]|uniref:Uncharacterized protein n=1 Tax=Seminavis robusta TaxID=568900 RepID=A0A9N8HQA1_9STRA|nr:expressed unknown protein [Seminavis robusta]|eukprot:Sro1418_g270930.1 n/a (292) ;mRNA; r:3798-4975
MSLLVVGGGGGGGGGGSIEEETRGGRNNESFLQATIATLVSLVGTCRLERSFHGAQAVSHDELFDRRRGADGQKKKDANGRSYYANRSLNLSTWDFPTFNDAAFQQNQLTTKTPPRSGVKRAPVRVLRLNVVDETIQLATSKSVCIIWSPPATGKTSLLDLLEDTLETGGVNSVKRLIMIEEAEATKNTEGLLKWLREELGVTKDLPGGYSELNPNKNTWILIDDAQLVYGEACRGFWLAVVKHLENSPVRNVYVAIAATYDLNSQGSTPNSFRDYPHVKDVFKKVYHGRV